MDKAERAVAYGFIGLALTAASGAVIVRLADMGAAHPGGGDLATWVGALGTFLALSGAIWIATSESRRRDRLALTTSQLVAAGMVLRLVHTQAVLTRMARKIHSLSIIDEGVGAFVKLAAQVDEIDLWSMEELLPMVALPKLAVQLAEARDQILTTKKVLLRAKDKEEHLISDGRRAFASAFHKNLSGTVDKVDQSVARCRQAADDFQKSSFK
jgi:hypothetical protein